MNGEETRDGNVVSLAAAESAILAKRYTEVFTLLHYKWADILAPTDMLVVQFVNLRTYKYGKPREYIPAHHFLRGVYSREGDRVIAGLHMSRSTLKRALKELEEIDVLRIHREKKSKGKDAANRFEINFKILQQGPEMASKLRVAKKIRQGFTQDTSGVHTDTHRGSQGHPNKLISNKLINNKHNRAEADASAQAGTLEENIEQATHKVRRRRRAKVETLSTRVTQAGIKALWEELCTKHYSHVPYVPMSRKEWAIFKRQYDSMKLRKTSIQDVMLWIVDDWENIMHGELKWIGKKENISAPSIIVLAKYLRYFVEQYRQLVSKEHSSTWAHRIEKREKRQADNTPSDIETAALRAEIQKLQDALKEREDRNVRSDRVSSRLERELKTAQDKIRDLQDQVPINYDDVEDLPEWGDNGK